MAVSGVAGEARAFIIEHGSVGCETEQDHHTPHARRHSAALAASRETESRHRGFSIRVSTPHGRRHIIETNPLFLNY